MTLEQMAGFKKGMAIEDGQEWDKFAGLGRAAGRARRPSSTNAPFNAEGRRRTEAPVGRDPGRAAAPKDKEFEHAGGLRQDPERHRGRGQRARPPHRHDLARRLGLDQSRRLDQPPRPVRPRRGARTCSASSRSCRPSSGARRRAASISSSASPRTISSSSSPRLASSHELFGARLLPIGTLYDPFIARGLDALNYACYQDARFMIVATPSGITLAPEGGAHQSIHTPLIGMGQPDLLTYEPAYVDELAILMRHGLRAHAGRRRRLGLSPPLDPQPGAAPAHAVGRAAASRSSRAATGTSRRRRRRHRHRRHGRRDARGDRGACERRCEDFAGAGLLVLTSPDRLHGDWLAAQRNRGRTTGLVDRTRLAGRAPARRRCRATPRLITVMDGHPLALSWLGSVRGQRVVPLGIEALRPVGRHPRPLPDLQARRRRHRRRRGARHRLILRPQASARFATDE